MVEHDTFMGFDYVHYKLLMNWNSDYPTNCSKNVVVNSKSSLPACISDIWWCHQLHPFFFVIYCTCINHLTKINLHAGAKQTPYVLTMCCCSQPNVHKKTLLYLKRTPTVSGWSCDSFLKHNRAKCKYMIVSHRKVSPTIIITSTTWKLLTLLTSWIR